MVVIYSVFSLLLLLLLILFYYYSLHHHNSMNQIKINFKMLS